MTDDDLGDHEQDDSWILRRRGLLKGAGGLAALGAVGASAESAFEPAGDTVLGIGGGSMADAAEQYRVKYYAPTWSEFQNDFSPGVRGRVIEIIDDGNAHDGEVYFDNGTSFRQPPVKTPEIITDEAGIGSFDAGFAAAIKGPGVAPTSIGATSDLDLRELPEAKSYTQNSDKGIHHFGTAFAYSDAIYYHDPHANELVGLADNSPDTGWDILSAVRTRASTTFVIANEAATSTLKCFWFITDSEILDTSLANASITLNDAPRPYAMITVDGDNKQTMLLAEYLQDQTGRVVRFDGDDKVFEIALEDADLPHSDYGHLHTVALDPFNTTHAWAVYSHSRDLWMRSTTGGEPGSWSAMLDDTAQSGKYQTLTLNFTPNGYVYWGTDHNVDDHCRVYRADKTDIINTTEEVAVLDEDKTTDGRLKIYGTTYIENPEGILIGAADVDADFGAWPLYFYSIERDTLRKLYWFDAADDTSASRPKMMPPHADKGLDEIIIPVTNTAYVQGLNEYNNVRLNLSALQSALQ